MPLFNSKKQGQANQPSASDDGYILRRDCLSCGNRATFDWAVCPHCGALAAGDPAPPLDSVSPGRFDDRAAQDARARFSDDPDYYTPVPAPDTIGQPMDRTDPDIGAATRIARPAEMDMIGGSSYQPDPNYGAPAFPRQDPNVGAATIIESRERFDPPPAPPAPAAPTTAAPAPPPPPAPPPQVGLSDRTVILRGGVPRQEGATSVELPIETVTHGPLAFVVERTGANVGRAHLLYGETHLGRGAECDIVIENSAVSKRHARIRYEDGGFVYWDLASANFSFLIGPDGERSRLLEPHRLRDGDTLDLADARVTFLDIDGAETPA